jgi:hypothetical protein
MTEQTEAIGSNEVPATLSADAVSLENVGRKRAEAAAATRNSSEREEKPRSRRNPGLGGAQLKLEVGKAGIPGFHLYWENDTDARIERLLGAGFEFVTKEEVGMSQVTQRVVADSEIDSRVSKYVGTTDDGKPMRAYLMKCPDELWEDIQYCINDLADSRDRDILESANRGGERYQPKGYETKVNSGMRR